MEFNICRFNYYRSTCPFNLYLRTKIYNCRFNFRCSKRLMKLNQKAVIGIDLGSTAIKGVIISEEIKTLSYDKINTKYLNLPNNNLMRKEFLPEDIYTRLCNLIRSLIYKAEIMPSDVAGISINGASGNTILLDKNKNPIGNAISWMDRRASGDIYDILPDIDITKIHQIVGWPWRGSFTFAELAWLKKYKSDIYNRTAYPCMYLEFLIKKITDAWEIDSSNATLSFLQNQEKREWYTTYCNMLDIDPNTRPSICNTGDIIGNITEDFCKKSGLKREAILVHGSFDHPGAAKASGVIAEHDILLSCGTSWVAFFPIEDRSTSISLGLLTLPFLLECGAAWAGMISLSRIGMVIDRYIDILCYEKSTDRYLWFNHLSSQAKPGSNGLFLNLMDQREKKKLDSRIFSSYSEENIARAVMEGAAFELYSNIRKVEKSSGIPKRIVMGGGPAESNIWPQIIADVTGLIIDIQEGQLAGSTGAALVAGRSIGVFTDDLDDYKMRIKKIKTIYPNYQNQRIYKEIFKIYENQKQ
ncbi:MAG: hypothetical protein GF364_04530 [Candidatus Lokiarchaeota archaeon]|nr:hypothetical protein [Candidatus Lokiarchaeota archaeon]